MKDQNTLRAVVVRPDVLLPAVSTDQGERPYSFLAFLGEWLLSSPGMRKDENLEHLFEWEDALERFSAKTAEGIEVPKPPAAPKQSGDPTTDRAVASAYMASPEVAAYQEENKAFQAVLSKARVGETFYVSDAAFLAGKAAAKDAIDEALSLGPAQRLPAAFGPKILRHYHALTMSKAVKPNDVPEEKSKANGAVNAPQAAASS
jgi:hypothetical protein